MSNIVSEPLSVAPASQPLEVRPAVKGLTSSAGQILLQKERHDDGQPFWTLPGGGIEGAEKPIQTLHRELQEELRVESLIGSAVGWFPYAHTGMTDTISAYTVFECTLLNTPKPNPAEGVYELRWADSNNLPPQTLPQVCWLVENV